MTEEIRNIFISHIHEDDEGLQKLKDVTSKEGMTIRDYSIKADNPNNAHSEDYIKSQILAPRINASGVLVVYISSETKDSKYVNWEIEYAQKQNKRIVGVWAWGEKGCELPEALHDYSDALVGWDGTRIVDAINGEINTSYNPDGTECSARDITRYTCR